MSESSSEISVLEEEFSNSDSSSSPLVAVIDRYDGSLCRFPLEEMRKKPSASSYLYLSCEDGRSFRVGVDAKK